MSAEAGRLCRCCGLVPLRSAAQTAQRLEELAALAADAAPLGVLPTDAVKAWCALARLGVALAALASEQRGVCVLCVGKQATEQGVQQ